MSPNWHLFMFYTAPDKRVNAKADACVQFGYSAGGVNCYSTLQQLKKQQMFSLSWNKKKQSFLTTGLMAYWRPWWQKKNPSDRPSSSDIVQDLTEIEKAIHNFDF